MISTAVRVVALALACSVAAACGGPPGPAVDAVAAVDGADGVDAVTDAAPEAQPDGFESGTCGVTHDCDPVTGGGCPAGQGCYLVAGAGGMTAAGCLPAGTGGATDACTAPNGCAPGLACVGGACAQLCCGRDDRARCMAAHFEGCLVATSNTAFWICAGRSCNPFRQDCPAGLACIPMDPSGTTDCVTAGAGTQGAPCGTQSACAPGFLCTMAGTASSAMCSQLCDPAASSTGDGGIVTTPCVAGTSCSRAVTLPPDIGVCVPG